MSRLRLLPVCLSRLILKRQLPVLKNSCSHLSSLHNGKHHHIQNPFHPAMHASPGISFSIVDPVVDKDCEAPPLSEFHYNFIFGEPIFIKPEVQDPKVLASLIDPLVNTTPVIELHKHDKVWRRRGMKHHRYLRWRKRNETLLAHMEERMAKKKASRFKIELENIWKKAGLENEPPMITDEQKKMLAMEWREEGIWTDALTPQEIEKFATTPLPKNRKVLSSGKLARYSLQNKFDT